MVRVILELPRQDWLMKNLSMGFKAVTTARFKAVTTSSVANNVLMVDSITFGQDMVNILVSGKEYDKVFNHLDMLNAPLEGKKDVRYEHVVMNLVSQLESVTVDPFPGTSLILKESHHRFFPVVTSLIRRESHKSPTMSLFDVGSSRISIFIVNDITQMFWQNHKDNAKDS
ncbi:hypothetical protein Tco_0475806 [Tanacetum coccineum]